jgi:hypothetical protein
MGLSSFSSLQELVLEEAKLTQAEENLYESFGIPPIESNEDRVNGATKPGRPMPHSQATLEKDRHLADHRNNSEGEDNSSDVNECSTGSFEKYRKYHPLYIEYHESRGTQDNLYESVHLS